MRGLVVVRGWPAGAGTPARGARGAGGARGVRGVRGVRGARGLAAATLLLAAAALGGCRLTEVTVAAPEDVVVAEVVLRAGASVQLAWLHRTLGNGSLTVPGATVGITGPGGGSVAFREVSPRECVDTTVSFVPDTTGSCYLAATTPADVVPGASYALRVVTADGRQLTGNTTVPGAFGIARPLSLAGGPNRGCTLAAETLLPLVWTRSKGAWLYVSEARMSGVRRALDPAAPGDAPLDLVGLSVSESDTSIVFPSELGLFDRADSADAPVLLALQHGLPPGVYATVTVAAADRNYVDWIRRGSFNPSGAVQIPSVRGDGTGLFGSLVPIRFDLTTTPNATLPACGS